MTYTYFSRLERPDDTRGYCIACARSHLIDLKRSSIIVVFRESVIRDWVFAPPSRAAGGNYLSKRQTFRHYAAWASCSGAHLRVYRPGSVYDVNVTYQVDNPRESAVSANYDAYIGRNVTISGEVVSAGAGSFELLGAQHVYTVFSTEPVQPGNTSPSSARGAQPPATGRDDGRVAVGARRARVRPLVGRAHLCGCPLFRQLAC